MTKKPTAGRSRHPATSDHSFKKKKLLSLNGSSRARVLFWGKSVLARARQKTGFLPLSVRNLRNGAIQKTPFFYFGTPKSYIGKNVPSSCRMRQNHKNLRT